MTERAIDGDATDWFSHTVPEAHATFVRTATAAGLDVEQVEHPLLGPGGETLHSAVTTFGPDDARNVVLCLSGIHGIEGYFGSAIQCDAIADADGLLRLPADTKIVFIHLVNPWGTAWSSRENEDNVELLRGNYYCHHPKPDNPVFVDFVETMDYRSVTSVEEFLATRGRVADVLTRHSIEELMAAMVDGQNTHPDAITYTGHGPTWTKRLIDRVVQERCGHAQRIVVFDLHTAVGPPGDTVVFTGYLPDSPKAAMVAEWFGGDLWPWPEYLEFYDWVGELVPAADVVSVTMEAGHRAARSGRSVHLPARRVDQDLRRPQRSGRRSPPRALPPLLLPRDPRLDAQHPRPRPPPLGAAPRRVREVGRVRGMGERNHQHSNTRSLLMTTIERVECLHLRFTMPPERTFSTPGGPATGRLTTLIRLTTDDGLVGIGSAYAHPALVQATVDHLTPFVLGYDPRADRAALEPSARHQPLVRPQGRGGQRDRRDRPGDVGPARQGGGPTGVAPARWHVRSGAGVRQRDALQLARRGGGGVRSGPSPEGSRGSRCAPGGTGTTTSPP